VSGYLRTFETIWETVRAIPRGKVASYAEVAEQSGFPRQARLVGYALHKLPPKSGVPWHRVITARGEIAFPRHSSTYRKQKALLEKEGVRFVKGRTDFTKYGWLRSVPHSHHRQMA
jgi:methylated-DNA-protein-cysteine methyltransferase-like protein